ncbi:MAG: VOC family protein [Erysipelotrichaceae bacterium]|nr:VOC family protein [Erysipelotrichaceae bacterium]
MIKGIHHVNLKVAGADKVKETVSFYHDLLGLELYRSWPGRNGQNYMLKAGEDIIEIMETESQADTGVINHFALATDKVDEVIDKIEKAGYRIDSYAKDAILRSEPPMEIRFAFFYGPADEYVEVFEEK